MQVGELSARLGLDSSEFISGLKDAQKHMKNMDSSTEKSKGMWSGLGDTMKNAVSFAGGMAIYDGLKRGMDAVVGAGINMDANLQENQIAFTTMLGSASKAKTMLADLAQFAAVTPFEMTQVEAGAKKLLAFGFSAQQVKPMLTSIGDAAAGLGLGSDGIDRLTMALGQMQAKGKVSAQDMMQLTDAGVPAWDILAKSMGKSTAEVMKLSEKGLIPADKAVQALVTGMEARFPHMMDAQSKSFNGLMSTLKDNMNMTFGQIMKPFFDWMTAVALPKAIELTTKFQQAFANGGFMGAVKAMVPGLQPVIDKIVQFGAIATPIIQNIAQQVMPMLQQVVTEVSTQVQTDFKQVQEIVKMVWPTVQEVIVTAATTIWDMIKTAWPAIQAIITTVHNVIFTAIKAAWPVIQDIISVVLEYIWPFVHDVFNKIAEFIKGVMPAIQTIITVVLYAIRDAWNVIFPLLKAIVIPIFLAISSGIKVVMDLIFGIIRIALDLISGHWGDAWKALKTMVVNIWGDIWGGIKGFINLIIGGINAMINGLNKLHIKMPDALGGATIGFNIPHIPALAKGTDWWKGGTALVGEVGPELVNLPRGSQVVPNNRINLSNSKPEAKQLPQAIELHLDGQKLARIFLPALLKEGQRSGLKLLDTLGV